MEITDRIAVMDHGQIEQVGAPRELYDNPASEFVMSFLGPVTEVDGGLVRPHDLSLSTVPVEDGREGQIARIVHLGFEVRVELVLEGGEEVSVQLTRAEAEQLELADGDIVYVRGTSSSSSDPRPASPPAPAASPPQDQPA